jgi:hypothetical protein
MDSNAWMVQTAVPRLICLGTCTRHAGCCTATVSRVGRCFFDVRGWQNRMKLRMLSFLSLSHSLPHSHCDYCTVLNQPTASQLHRVDMNQAKRFSHRLLLSTALSYLSTVLANWDAYDKMCKHTLNQYVPQSCLFGSNNFTATQKGNACLCPNIPFIAMSRIPSTGIASATFSNRRWPFSCRAVIAPRRQRLTTSPKSPSSARIRPKAVLTSL